MKEIEIRKQKKERQKKIKRAAGKLFRPDPDIAHGPPGHSEAVRRPLSPVADSGPMLSASSSFLSENHAGDLCAVTPARFSPLLNSLPNSTTGCTYKIPPVSSPSSLFFQTDCAARPSQFLIGICHDCGHFRSNPAPTGESAPSFPSQPLPLAPV
jgi:hypothetical protein